MKMDPIQETMEATAWRVENGAGTLRRDCLAIEAPLQIELNGKAFSVTMRTPGHDDWLVRGLLLSDGIVRPDGSVETIELLEVEGVDTARVQVPDIYLCERVMKNQALITHASCGYCGKKSFEGFPMLLTPPREPLPWTFFGQLEEKLRQAQDTFRASGGAHAAAAFAREGHCLCLFEDVGRHNAVDKVIGYLLFHDRIADAAVLQVSGRVSFEIVNKACRAGIPYLSAISAPSSLAVEAAKGSGLTLVAFNRQHRFTIYSHPENIAFSKEE
jgi:FdhD protein